MKNMQDGAVQFQTESDGYVLVGGSFTQIDNIKEGVRLAGVEIVVSKNVTNALDFCMSNTPPKLFVVGVRDGQLGLLLGCQETLREYNPPIIALGPERCPALRVQCFRSGVVDYIDVGASPKEVRLRLEMHLNLGRVREVVPQVSELPLGTAGGKREIHRLVVKYLERSGIVNITPQLLASRVGVPLATLDSAFRSVDGRSVVRFLKRRRINIARTLLSEGRLSITAIAELLGFSGSANFSTTFRLAVGMTPSEYRDSSAQSGKFRTEGGAVGSARQVEFISESVD